MEKIRLGDKFKEKEWFEYSQKDLSLSKIIDNNMIDDIEVLSIKQRIDVEDKVFLFERYVQDFFNEELSPVVRFISSKYGFILGVIDRCTNIDISYLEPDDINLFVDGILSSGMWGIIVKTIYNYDETKKDLYGLTKMISEERLAEKQVGQMIDNVYQKIVDFVSDLDTEKIESLTKEFAKGIKQLEDNGIVLPSEISQKEK